LETALTTAVLDPIGTIINWFRRGSLDNTTSIGSMGGDNGIWHRGARAGGASGLPISDFSVLSDGSVVPTIGTAGTFTRASVFLNPTGPNTLSSVASGTAVEDSMVQGEGGPTHTLGGTWLTSAITNYQPEASTFDNWTANGTAAVTANDETDPAGGSTADKIAGGAANDGVEQATNLGTASRGQFFVWLKADSGSRTVTILIKDSAGAPVTLGTENVTVTTSWQLFEVSTNTAGTGNAVNEIIVNDTTGYEIWAYGAGHFSWKALASLSTNAAYTMAPTIISTGASTSLAASQLRYEGAEIAVSNAKWTISIWMYNPAIRQSFFWGTQYLYNLQNLAFATYVSLRINAASQAFEVAINDATYSSTGYRVDTQNQNEWVNVIVAVDGAGDNECFVNGSSEWTSVEAFAAFTPGRLALGSRWGQGSNLETCTRTLLGQTDVWVGERFDLSQALTHYDDTKGNYGI